MSDKICAVEECPCRVLAKGLCSKHYDRQRKTGTIELRQVDERKCTIDDCGRPHYAKGLCQKHYNMATRYGRTEKSVPAKELPCSIEGCDRLVHARGLCQSHYKFLQRNGAPVPLLKEERQQPGPKAKAAPSMDNLPEACRNGHPMNEHTAYINGKRLRCKMCIRESVVLRLYGLSAEEFNAMLEEQEGACAICRGPFSGEGPRSIHVDHDHSTGAARGLLCHSCNMALGAFGDDVSMLQRAIEYLGAHQPS